MHGLNNQFLRSPLTDRERDVLRLMAEGFTTGQIAEELVVTVGTVRWYAKRIYSKLGVHSRSQAALRARDLGLFEGLGATKSLPQSSSPRQNLPAYSTSFIGREEEFNELLNLLGDPNARLITIAGPGGIGKTRLCVEAARAQINGFADGVYFISLAPLTTADQIVPAVARGIQFHLNTGDEPEAQLLRYLRAKQILLVLDNFEHVLDGVTLVARILETAGSIKVLATSRAALNLQQEWVRYLDGMRLPFTGELGDLDAHAAVRLFLDRAQRVRGGFLLAENRDCVLEICRMVEGNPLAIELAAAWLKTLSCADVIKEIRGSIDFLVTKQRDADERHRSMRAVFDQSWRLLTEKERRMLMRLSVFRGGFGLAAVEQVAGAYIQDLSNLIEKSVIAQRSAGFFEIHDLLRQYAEKTLEQTVTATLTAQSTMLLAWSSLLKGDFEKAKELAEGILDGAKAGSNPAEEVFGLALLGVLAGIDEDHDRCLQMCTASLSLSQRLPELEEPITHLFANLGSAVASIGQEDYFCARHYTRSALSEAVILRSPAFATLCLPIVAIIFAHEAQFERAVELIGLAFTHRASTPSWMKKWPPLAHLLVDLEAELGAETFEAVWARGKALELQTATAGLLAELV